MFVLVYSNENTGSKRFKAKRYYLPKGIIKTYHVIIKGKSLYDQEINFDVKRYEEIRKLTTGQGEVYATGCILHYDYIKNHYLNETNFRVDKCSRFSQLLLKFAKLNPLNT